MDYGAAPRDLLGALTPGAPLQLASITPCGSCERRDRSAHDSHENREVDGVAVEATCREGPASERDEEQQPVADESQPVRSLHT